jgi:DNA-binding MarR family transcriptional regulator
VDQELTDGIRVLARLALVADRICLDAGISLVQYRLLFVIAEQPQRAGHLADRLAVSRPTLTAAAHSLVDRGLVSREPVVGDGRGVQLRLTPEGAATVRRVEEGIVEVMGGGASADEVGAALRCLHPMRASLDLARERFRRAEGGPSAAAAVRSGSDG